MLFTQIFLFFVLPLQILLAWSSTLLNSVTNRQMATYGGPFLSYGCGPCYLYAHITEPSPIHVIRVYFVCVYIVNVKYAPYEKSHQKTRYIIILISHNDPVTY